MIRVTDAPYFAKGDGVSCDRAAIQTAIDDASRAGGDTVVFSAGKTFKTGNLFLRSNVRLHLEEGAVILQSGEEKDYVDADYKPAKIRFGHNVQEVAWGHSLYLNYPFLYAPEGTENIAVTGKGTFQYTRGHDCEDTIHVVAICMYGVHGFELSDFTVQGNSGYNVNISASSDGLVKNLTVRDTRDGNGDGICMCCCQNIRVTGCNLLTSDDGIIVGVNYGDPRTNLWSHSDKAYPSRNIEIDHNHCEVTWDATKCFCFIMWGNGYSDPCAVETSNIYIHDNYFQTMGAWTGNWDAAMGDFNFNGKTNAMKNIRMENNEVGTLQGNWYDMKWVSDFVGFDSMTELHNGDFANGDLYWISRHGEVADSAGYCGEEKCGYVADLDKTDSALYQGIKLEAGKTYVLSASVKTEKEPVRLFVREQVTNGVVATHNCTDADWNAETLLFTVPVTGNYRLGLERGTARRGYACIKDVKLEEKE